MLVSETKRRFHVTGPTTLASATDEPPSARDLVEAVELALAGSG